MTSKSPVEKYSVQITESLNDEIGTPMFSMGIIEGGIEAIKGPAFCVRRGSAQAVMVVYLLSCCSWTDEWPERDESQHRVFKFVLHLLVK